MELGVDNNLLHIHLNLRPLLCPSVPVTQHNCPETPTKSRDDVVADTVSRSDHPALVHQDGPAPVTNVPHYRVPELDGNLPWPGPMSGLLTIDDPRRTPPDQGPQGVPV